MDLSGEKMNNINISQKSRIHFKVETLYCLYGLSVLDRVPGCPIIVKITCRNIL